MGQRFLLRLWRLLLLPLVLALMAVAGAPTTTCAGPFRTLTFDCDEVCATPGAACIVESLPGVSPCQYVDVSPASRCANINDACVYECFEPRADDPSTSTFKFFITFNATRETQGPFMPNAVLDRTNDVPYESNALVRRIGKLRVPPATTRILIAGGRSEDGGARGTVVDVSVDPEAFAQVGKATIFALLNMNLGDRLEDVAALLPAGTEVLDLTNTRLKAAPASLSKMTKLDTLSLSKNYLSTWPDDLQLPSLQRLFLSENKLTNFSAPLKSLLSLDLSSNSLTSFPTGVLALPRLKILKLAGNPISPTLFSASQFAVLAKLEEFTIDKAALDSKGCDASALKKLPNGAMVCVLSDDKYLGRLSPTSAPTASPRTDSSSASASSASSASSSSSSTRDANQSTNDVVIPTPPSPSSPDRTNTSVATTAHGSSSLSTATTIGIITAVILVVCGSIVLVRWRRHKRNDNNKSTEDSGRGPFAAITSGTGGSKTTNGDDGSSPSVGWHSQLRSTTSSHALWDDAELLAHQLRVEDIEDVRLIGSGGCGVVWLVTYRQSRLLASKRLIRDQLTRQKTLDFVAEIRLVAKLEHPSIVPFVGVAWTTETDLQALFAYMPNGDLHSYLASTLQASSDGRTPGPWDRAKVELAIDIIEALVYVHSFNPPLVHPVKSRNVLLDEAMRAKLSDFGVSRFQSENGTMTTGVGTGRWLAPEVIAGSRAYDAACDVYAFGVVLSELDAHALPYEDVRGPQGHRLPEVAILQLVGTGQLRPRFRASSPAALRALADECLDFDPRQRPSAMQVAFQLRRLLREVPAEMATTAADDA